MDLIYKKENKQVTKTAVKTVRNPPPIVAQI